MTITARHIKRWLKYPSGFVGAQFGRGTIVTKHAQRLMMEHNIGWTVDNREVIHGLKNNFVLRAGYLHPGPNPK